MDINPRNGVSEDIILRAHHAMMVGASDADIRAIFEAEHLNEDEMFLAYCGALTWEAMRIRFPMKDWTAPRIR